MLNRAFNYDPILKFENSDLENSPIAKSGHVLWICANRPYEAKSIKLKSNYDHNTYSDIRAETSTFKFKGSEWFEDGSWKYPTLWY